MLERRFESELRELAPAADPVVIYTLYSLIGGVAWCTVVTLAGFYLGKFKFVRDHVDLLVVLAIVVVVLFTTVPALVHWRTKRGSRAVESPTPEQAP